MESTDDTAVMTLTGPDGVTTPPFTMAELQRATEALNRATRLKPDPQFDAAAERVYAVTADELRQFVERYEHLEVERKDVSDQMKEVMAEAKGRGYDTKALRKVIALRKRKPDDLAEEQAVLELYKSALGMV